MVFINFFRLFIISHILTYYLIKKKTWFIPVNILFICRFILVCLFLLKIIKKLFLIDQNALYKLDSPIFLNCIFLKLGLILFINNLPRILK